MIVVIGSYILVVSILLWFSSKGYKFKWQALVFVPLCIWYSITLGVGLNSMLGYASESTIPDNGVIKSIHIKEPNKEYPGVMCFWVISPEDLSKPDAEPRAHKMPYDKELHKQLMKAQSKKNGVLVWSRIRDGQRGLAERVLRGPGIPSEKGKFLVLNPAELLTKEEDVQLKREKECEGVCQ